MKPISSLQISFFFFKAKNFFLLREICLWVFPPKGSSSFPPRAPPELSPFQSPNFLLLSSLNQERKGDGLSNFLGLDGGFAMWHGEWGATLREAAKPR